MKRSWLLAELRRAAKEAGVELVLVRHGANHDIFLVLSLRTVVPRHRESNELTARGILLDVADHLERRK